MTLFILRVQHPLWKWCSSTKSRRGRRSGTARSDVPSGRTRRGSSGSCSLPRPLAFGPKMRALKPRVWAR